jgi:hypothetical protein
VLRPQQPRDEIEGLREAVLKAPEISDVYKHYRGENLPDDQFFDNALVDTFRIPQGKVNDFKSIFVETLKKAQLIEADVRPQAPVLEALKGQRDQIR